MYSAQQQDNYENNEALFTEKSVKTLTHKTFSCSNIKVTKTFYTNLKEEPSHFCRAHYYLL